MSPVLLTAAPTPGCRAPPANPPHAYQDRLAAERRLRRAWLPRGRAVGQAGQGAAVTGRAKAAHRTATQPASPASPASPRSPGRAATASAAARAAAPATHAAPAAPASPASPPTRVWPASRRTLGQASVALATTAVFFCPFCRLFWRSHS